MFLLDLNADKISVSSDVVEEMDRMRQNAPLKLCFKPIYNLDEACLKIVFVNSRSLTNIS